MDGPAPQGTVLAVETRSFRNLDNASVGLAPAITVLHGPNGAGKTNLLEAVYFALTGCSFRPGSDRDAINHDERTARAEIALATNHGSAQLMASVDRSGERRHLLDGGPAPSPSANDSGGAQRPLVSVFLPDRLTLVKGPPAHRRSHLDRFAGALRPARAELRQRFGRALAQRNALVSRIRAGLASNTALETWDARLAAEAAPLIVARAEATEALQPHFTALAERLGLPGCELRYRPRFDGDESQLISELARLRADGELGRGYTTFGPQLDELEMRCGGRPLRRFGSQGQQRTALLALLFAERAALIDSGRRPPLMLLDDVMSELDPERRALLVETIAPAGQSLITATEPEQVPGVGREARVAVDGGRATPGLAAVA